MRYGWLECLALNATISETEKVVHFWLFDGTGSSFFIRKDTEDLQVGADNVSLVRVEILERDGVATKVRVPLGARCAEEKVCLVWSCHLRTEFKEVK